MNKPFSDPLSGVVRSSPQASLTGQDRTGQEIPPLTPPAGGNEVRADRARRGSRRQRDVAALRPSAPTPPRNLAGREEAERIWVEVREFFRPSIPASAFEHWIEPFTALGILDGVLCIGGPERTHEWMRRRYGTRAGDVVREVSDLRGLRLYVVEPQESDVL